MCCALAAAASSPISCILASTDILFSRDSTRALCTRIRRRRPFECPPPSIRSDPIRFLLRRCRCLTKEALFGLSNGARLLLNACKSVARLLRGITGQSPRTIENDVLRREAHSTRLESPQESPAVRYVPPSCRRSTGSSILGACLPAAVYGARLKFS